MSPSPKQLKKMALHICYEVTALDIARDLYATATRQQSHYWIIGLECSLLHIRVLRDFFLSATRLKDDLMASDYFDDPALWFAAAGPEDPIFAKTRDRLNKQLAHLSVKRADYNDEEFGWSADDQAALHKAIVDLKCKFYGSLPSERRRWFDVNRTSL